MNIVVYNKISKEICKGNRVELYFGEMKATMYISTANETKKLFTD